jgi:hypothetical protein
MSNYLELAILSHFFDVLIYERGVVPTFFMQKSLVISYKICYNIMKPKKCSFKNSGCETR